MKKNIIFFLLIILSLLLISCRQNNSNTAENKAVESNIESVSNNTKNITQNTAENKKEKRVSPEKNPRLALEQTGFWNKKYYKLEYNPLYGYCYQHLFPAMDTSQEKDVISFHVKDLTLDPMVIFIVHKIAYNNDTYELSGTIDDKKHTLYIKVQDGCNQFCSYCIIPYARGRVRSRKPEDVVKEISLLVDQGIKEFVLTGIHLSSYGVDQDGIDLLYLIREIAAIRGVERIRLGSLEPGIITEEFIQAVTQIRQFCPHFHLSLQSACNETLKRMNRRYTIEEYKQRCELIRAHFDLPVITTDVIVGFPGETEEEFLTTKRNLEQLNLYEIHVFKYSRRKGTRADRMPDQVPEQEKHRRSNQLLDLTKAQKRAFEEHLIGQEEEVLLEEPVSVNGTTYFTGYTKNYVKIGVEGEGLGSNQIVRAKVLDYSDKDFLIAKRR